MRRHMQYGIDLGATNSRVACCEGTQVRIVPNSEHASLTPSAVRVLRGGEVIVGHRAYRAQVGDPENVATLFSARMGTKDSFTFPASGRTMSAEELAAEVLKSLRADVQRETGDDMTSAVIAMPLAAGMQHCKAITRAAQLAGVTGCVLLPAPIAAAMACGITSVAAEQHWLVFDLGGGSLDVAIVASGKEEPNVMAHWGSNRVGGRSIDLALAETLFLSLLGRGFALPQPGAPVYRRFIRLLLLKAEAAKIALDTAPNTTVTLSGLGEDRSGKPIEAELSVTQSQLANLMEPLLHRCLATVGRALEAARISAGDIAKTILVGGTTLMPVVRGILRDRLGASIDSSVDPMTVVARGAALFAATRKQPASISVLSDGEARRWTGPPLAHTLSVEIVRPDGGIELDPVIGKGAPLPAEKTLVYRAAHALDPADPNRMLAVKLWAGETLNEPGANTWVGNLCVCVADICRAIPEGTEIEVTVKVDSLCLTTVDVFIPRLGQRFSATHLPEGDERDYSGLARSLAPELGGYGQRLAKLEAPPAEGSLGLGELSRLQQQLNNLSIEAGQPWGDDPSEVRRLIDASRGIRARISSLEGTVGVAASSDRSVRTGLRRF